MKLEYNFNLNNQIKEDEIRREENKIKISDIQDPDIYKKIQDMVSKKSFIIYNYAQAELNKLKEQGLNFSMTPSLSINKDYIEIRIIIKPEDVSQDLFSYLNEMIRREKYLSQIKLAPRGTHLKKN